MTANPFPDGSPVETPFPFTPEQKAGPRGAWPWLPGTVPSRCGPDEFVDKPEEAKGLLVDLLGRGARDPAVTWCNLNLALAESLLGQVDAALEACEQAYEAGNEDSSAYLWMRHDEDWVVERIKPRTRAIRLGALVLFRWQQVHKCGSPARPVAESSNRHTISFSRYLSPQEHARRPSGRRNAKLLTNAATRAASAAVKSTGNSR